MLTGSNIANGLTMSRPGSIDPKFVLWALDQNRAYELQRARHRMLYPDITKGEIEAREIAQRERKERWLEKLRGMRD